MAASHSSPPSGSTTRPSSAPCVILALCVWTATSAVAQTVSNVRASQLSDGAVEVVYDLTGTAPGGATVAVSFSRDGGETYEIRPDLVSLSGHVGPHVPGGKDRRIRWAIAETLPANTNGNAFRATVSATNPFRGDEAQIQVSLPGGVPLVLRMIPAGSFVMGSPSSDSLAENAERPQHQVTITSDYYIGTYEVTQGQWQAVMGANPSRFKTCGSDCPVETVSWDMIRGPGGFLERLNAHIATTGQDGAGQFCLPTEAQWERAARGDTTTRFSFPDTGYTWLCRAECPCGLADPYAWFCGNSGITPHAVGTKRPNPYGLFDVHGNVAEWIEDWTVPYKATAVTDPHGLRTTATYRGIRDGHYGNSVHLCRSASRGGGWPAWKADYVGFRLARSLTTESNVFSADLVHACSFECSAAVPDRAAPGTAVTFLAQATASACSEPVAFTWDFGDGDGSDTQNATHVYKSSRTYDWSVVVSQGGRTCTKAGRVSIVPPFSASLMQFEGEFSGAHVYSVPFAVSDSRLRVAAGELLWNRASAAALALLIPPPFVALEVLGIAAELMQVVQTATNPVGVVPIAAGLAVGATTVGTVPADTTAIGALVTLDFISASWAADPFATATEPLYIRMFENTLIPIASRTRTLLTASELRSLAADSHGSKAYLVFPRTPFRVGDIPFRCGLCNNTYSVTLEAAVGRGFTSSRTFEVHKDAGESVPVERTLVPKTASRVDPSSSLTSRQAALVCIHPSTAAQGPTSVRTLTAPCAIRVSARDRTSAAELASTTVPAEGFQQADLGVLPPGGWYAELVSGCPVQVGVTVFSRGVGDLSTERVVPIVLDVESGSARFTTEAVLANRGTTNVHTRLTYVPSLGPGEGAGSVSMILAPGEQRILPDALSFLRYSGLALPDRAAAPSQGGAVRVVFDGVTDTDAVAVTARTTAITTAPLPEGAAGLAYSAVSTATGSSPAFVFGLRSDSADRSNLALFNPSVSDVILRVTAIDGSLSGRSVVVANRLSLPPLGWTQFSRFLDGAGMTAGWAQIEKVGGSGAFGSYGVVNDNLTNDGSFIVATSGAASGSRLTVPVLVETSTLRSELVLANRGASTASLVVSYLESQNPAAGPGGSTTVNLQPREQLIVPEAIDWLRKKGVGIGALGSADYVGALRISVAGVPLSEVYAGARTAARSSSGGQFGLFAPGTFEGDEATDEAFVYGLQADPVSRSNVAVLNAGRDTAGNILLEARTFDGDQNGTERGFPQWATLSPGQFRQFNGILANAGIRNGWVRIRRVSGTAPWIAYGVVNDGGSPGERTGDGAYIPMTTK